MPGLFVNDSRGNIKQSAPKSKFLKGDIFEGGAGQNSSRVLPFILKRRKKPKVHL
jgi:hypothetical protein